MIFVILFVVCVDGASSNEIMAIGSITLNPNEAGHLTVSLENTSDVKSVYFELLYDHTLMSVSGITASNDISNPVIVYNINNNVGLADISLTNVNVTGTNKVDVVDISLNTINSGNTEIKLQNVTLENTSSVYQPEYVVNGFLRVNYIPEIVPLDDMIVLVGENLNFSVNATDEDDSYLAFSASGLPEGSEFNEITGSFNWTTKSSDVGIHPVEFSVSDGMSQDIDQITITVEPIAVNNVPDLESPGNVSVDENEYFEITLDASDTDGDHLTYSMDASFGTLTDNTFSWTPEYDDAGIYYIEFAVSDGYLNDSEIVTITVNNVNRAPIINSIPTQLVDEMDTLNLELIAHDDDGDTLYYSKDVTFGELNGNVFFWTPANNDSGVHNVIFTVTDGFLSDSQNVTIAVGNTNVPPVLDPIGDKFVNESQSLSFVVNASDTDEDSLVYSASGLPDGATFDTVSRTFSWTPSYDQAGVHKIVFEVSDGTYNDVELVGITVNNFNRAPVLSPIGNRSVNENEELSIILSGSDPDIGDTLVYSGGILPSGSSFNEVTHEFVWTPGYDDAGTYTVSFTVSDGLLSDSETIDILVSELDRAPVLSPVGSKSVDEGDVLSFIIAATDPDGSVVGYSSPSLPDDSALDHSSGEFTWKTDYNDAGIYTVEFIATSDGLSDSEIISITVNHLNRDPVLDVIGPKSIDEGHLLSFSLEAQDPDGDSLIYSANSLPVGSGLDEASGLFTWTPSFEDSGTYSVEFVVSDGYKKDMETVAITVNNINRPPSISIPAQINVPENISLILDLNVSDPDGDSLECSTDADFGSLNGNVFTWTPGFEDAGSYDVSFNVTDGEYEMKSRVNITVAQSNCAPVLYSIPDHLVNELEILTINLEAIDVDMDELTYSKNVSFGELNGNVFTWKPEIDQSGFHYITFTVSDGTLMDSKIAKIAVGNTNLPPELIYIGSKKGHENETLSFELNASDTDEDILTYSAVGLPAGAALNATSGLFEWTPTFEQEGSYTVEFRVSDQIYTDLETITIEIEHVNRAPVFDQIPDCHVNETETLKIDLNAIDPDGDSLSFSTTTSYGSVIGSTFSWTPAYFDGGVHSIEFTVSDGYLEDTCVVSVQVSDINMPPDIDYIGPKYVSENETLNFSVIASDVDGDALTYSVSGLPDGASFNALTGLFTWKPTYNQDGTYSVEFKVSDGQLNSSMAVSVIVNDVDLSGIAVFEDTSSTGGGSGGGGGAGSSVEDYENIWYKDYSLRYVAHGLDISFDFPNKENDLEYVRFTSLKAAGQVKAVVEILNDQSSLVRTAPPGKVYRNINIWVGDAKFNSGNYFSYAEIGFKVERQWLSDNNIDPSSVMMCRYSNGAWEELPTLNTGSDRDYYYFKSGTRGFSPFAIAAREPSPGKSKAPSQVSVDDTETLLYTFDPTSTSGNKLSGLKEYGSSGTGGDVSYQQRPFDVPIFLFSILGILAIGAILSYRSRNDSDVLRNYSNMINSFIVWIRDCVSRVKYEMSSESLKEHHEKIIGYCCKIRETDYMGTFREQLENIRSRH